MTGALDGITVVDLTRGKAGALATMFLSDHGARVIRVLDGQAELHRSGGYAVWDRGKMAVELADGEDADRANLIAGADVLIEDFGPSVRPASIAFSHLQRAHPELIVCSLTAYGEVGPLKDEPAIDDLVLARLGVLAGLPGFREGPIHAAHPLPSVGAGLLAALGIAAALYQREETGHGCHVETSLVAGALLYHPKVVADHLARHVFQTNPFGSAPFYSVYACADGEWIQLGCVHPGFIARAAELMGIADVLADPVYGQGQAPQTEAADSGLRARVGEVMGTRTSQAWISDFEARDIPFARAQSNAEGMEDAQVRHNGMLACLSDPVVGKMQCMGAPIKMGATPAGPLRARATQAVAVDAIDAKQSVHSEHGDGSAPTDQLPLAGVRVLEITNLIAGPIAGRLLADIGADVMKLEPPAGDISRPIGRTYFYSINFGKRSVAVDTARPEGKEVVRRLAARSDVLLANLRPGATTRMGIGNKADPMLIETQISGYGLDGPYAHRPGIDPLAQALIGLERAQGGDGNPPSFTAQLAPTDFTTGTMAALGTVMALFARRRGRADGQRVEVNLLDGGIVLSSAWFTRYQGRPERPLADRGQHGPTPFHRLYACADGYLYVAADAPAGRAAFLETFGLKGLSMPDPVDATHPNDSALGTAAAAAFAKLTLDAAGQKLSDAGIAFAPALAADSEVFFDDPHTELNGWSVTRAHPTAGHITAACRYVRFGGTPSGDIAPTPLLGEHADAILREAGFAVSEIAQLRADGLVVSE